MSSYKEGFIKKAIALILFKYLEKTYLNKYKNNDKLKIK